MNKLLIILLVATVVLIGIGAAHPVDAGTLLGIEGGGTLIVGTPHTPEQAVQNLLALAQHHEYRRAMSLIANTDEVDQAALMRDLGGDYNSLRTYSSLESYETKPLQSGTDQATIEAKIKWSSVVGTLWDTRDLQVKNEQGRWLVVWPARKQAKVPPQVIPVNYLRWDVVYRGADEDWGAQDVDAPHVRIIAMNPVERNGNVIIMGELLNEDTVPAYVNVSATLLDKNNDPIATENSFDKISHLLLPRQVTPFRIDFPGRKLSQVENVKMDPMSILVPASADPVVVVQDQQRNGTQLTGSLENESGQIVNIPQVLVTFYNKNGQIVWVGDSYVDRALLPKSPQPFAMNIPKDIAGEIADFRVMVNPYVADRLK
jgi:hypothetical protein